jgi:heme-degrading monooxygenase HmoA
LGTSPSISARRGCNTVTRIWSAQTTPAQAPAYVDHLKGQVLPILRTLDGFAGVLLLQRAVAGAVEIIVITFWESLEAIRGFAGPDLEGAVVADEAAALLTHFDRQVRHYEVIVKEDVQDTQAGK